MFRNPFEKYELKLWQVKGNEGYFNFRHHPTGWKASCGSPT